MLLWTRLSSMSRLQLMEHGIGWFLKRFHLVFFESSWFPKAKKKKIHYRKQRQRAISEQVFMIFGHCQNPQNQTLKRPYLPKESLFKNYFYAITNTTLRLYFCQIFIFLLGHLHFFVDFFFTFMETTSMSCLFLHKNIFQIMICLADMALWMSNFDDFDNV